MKKFATLISFAIILVLAASSCEKDLFDKEIVKEMLDYSFHNDTLDMNHTWRLMSEHSIQIKNTVSNSDRVLLLTADPHDIEIVALINDVLSEILLRIPLTHVALTEAGYAIITEGF